MSNGKNRNDIFERREAEWNQAERQILWRERMAFHMSHETEKLIWHYVKPEPPLR